MCSFAARFLAAADAAGAHWERCAEEEASPCTQVCDDWQDNEDVQADDGYDRDGSQRRMALRPDSEAAKLRAETHLKTEQEL